MEKSWLFVVIPSRNGERWLAAALQSLVDQKEPGLEVIFIDGSADDASSLIVSGFADELAVRAECRPDLFSWMAKTNFAVEELGVTEFACCTRMTCGCRTDVSSSANGFPLSQAA